MDKHHILVVDDNHINRLFFESSLKKLDLVVSLAENGFQAIELCRQQRFTLILMDIRMDGLDGIQTATAIKALETHQNTPILAVSAERFDFEQHPEFDNSLLKPISQDELKRVLATYIPGNQFNSNCFDESVALQISHQDSNIVNKLRQLLVNQLPDDWQQIEQLYNDEDWSALSDSLHKLLGSAKICAATLLIHQIEPLKTSVELQQIDAVALQQLKAAIDKTIEVAGKNPEAG